MAKISISTVEGDVLVIGGGLAGCWAAYKALETGSKVILVDRGKVSRSGKSSFSGASILCPLPQDDLDVWHMEMASRGDYVSDQDWIDIILQEIPSRVKDMEAMGIEFERDKKGQLIRSVGLAHKITRVTNLNSFHMIETLKKRLMEKGVKLIEKTMITELLTSDGGFPTKGRVCGAIGFNINDGSPVIIHAGAVVIATGATGLFDQSGDGIAQALRVGAEVMNIEFARMWGVGFAGKYGGIHLNTWQRLGMYLRNAKGERFMQKYEPEQMERADRKQLGPAIAMEYLAGRGPVYADVTHIGKENLSILRNLFTTRDQIREMENDGLNLAKDKIQVYTHTGHIDIDRGGIRHNPYCETAVPGLYVAGEAGGYPAHGTYSVGGVNLATCCVEGYRAGEYGSRYAKEMGRAPLDKKQTDRLLSNISLPLKNKKGKNPDKLMEEFSSFISATDISLFRTAKSLTRALKGVRGFQEETPDLKAKDWLEVMKSHKMKNLLLCAEIIFSVELMREESRGSHIRIDYPYRDNANWLKWVIPSMDEKSKISLYTVPVPIYRYAARPEKYEKEPFSMPLPKVKK